MTAEQQNYINKHPEDVQYIWYATELQPEIKKQLSAFKTGIYYECWLDFQEIELNKYYEFRKSASISTLAAMAINYMRQRDKKY